MNYKKLLALIILAFGFQSYAQEKKVIYFSDILEEALFSGKDTLLIENVTVLMEFSDEEKIFKGYPYGFDLDAFIEKYSD